MSNPTPGPQRSISEDTPVRSNVRGALFICGACIVAGASFGGWMTAMQMNQEKLAEGQLRTAADVGGLRTDVGIMRQEQQAAFDDFRARLSSLERAIGYRPVSTISRPPEGQP